MDQARESAHRPRTARPSARCRPGPARRRHARCLACGMPGRHTRYLAELGLLRVVGVDRAPPGPMLDRGPLANVPDAGFSLRRPASAADPRPHRRSRRVRPGAHPCAGPRRRPDGVRPCPAARWPPGHLRTPAASTGTSARPCRSERTTVNRRRRAASLEPPHQRLSRCRAAVRTAGPSLRGAAPVRPRSSTPTRCPRPRTWWPATRRTSGSSHTFCPAATNAAYRDNPRPSLALPARSRDAATTDEELR